jgi:hypothetical protein
MNRVALALIMWSLLVSDSRGQEAVDPESVLKQFVGSWKTEISFKSAEWTPEARTVHGEMTIKPILNGKFIEETGRTLGEDTEHRVLWGYDARGQAFRCWFFDSQGTAIDWTGKWNPRTRTMVSEGSLPDGLTSHSEHRFLKPDYYEWTSVTKDKSGKVFLDMHGKHTRVKDGSGKARPR